MTQWAWQGTLARCASEVRAGTLVTGMEEGYRRAFGPPAPSEVDAWRASLPGVVTALEPRLPRETHVVLEYRLPFNGQRADCVLLGAGSGGPTAHVVEVKCWERSAPSALRHFVSVGGHDSPHPSYQAATYAGKLRFFHSAAQNWDVSASALVVDHDSSHHRGLRDARYDEVLCHAPVFLPGEAADFVSHVSQRLAQGPSATEARDFLDGRYLQSIRLLDGLRERQAHILQMAAGALAVSGWGLSEDQHRVFAEIALALERGERAVYLVRGGPGSGKTLLALYLLFEAARQHRSAVLAIRNNRLLNTLERIFSAGKFGLGGVLKYFSTPQKTGVEDAQGPVAEILVCDEAQRLALDSDNVLRRAKLTVIIYDDSQILNLDEHGTLSALTRMVEAAGLEPFVRELPTLHRCRGGRDYALWVETFLDDPSRAAAQGATWRSEYDLGLVDSADQLVNELRARRAGGRRVALVAAFTRSSGNASPKRTGDLGRVRLPAAEVGADIAWLMDPKREYPRFWAEGGSNDLAHCASIYGCQGFETDFAGIVWGDDFIIRDGQWRVGNPDRCYDEVRRSLRTVMKKNPDAALRLLRNRYRIFLTRGIFGARIHCEDAETRDVLRAILERAPG